MMAMVDQAKKCLLLIFIACIYCHLYVGLIIKRSDGTNMELIYPEKLDAQQQDKEFNKPDDDFVTYKLSSKHKDFILDVKKREPIHSGSIHLLTYNDDGTSQVTEHIPEDYHYHGEVRDHPNSYVYLSDSKGSLTGTIDDGKSVFDIEPHGTDGSHAFYSSEHILNDIRQRLKNSDTFNDINLDDEEQPSNQRSHRRSRRAVDNIPELRPFELINVEPQYIPYFTTNKTRYIEMLVTTTPGMYEHYKSEQVVLERVLNCVGQVDMVYSAINIRIVLVAVEIQKGSEKFERFRHGNKDLVSYKYYVKNVLRKSYADQNITFDNAQLFSHEYWTTDEVAGRGYLGGMCTSINSVAVNWWSYKSVTGASWVLEHELGHNMNFPHDGSECKCLSQGRGCVMGGGKSRRPGFTDCNMKRLAEKKFSCLNNSPRVPLFSQCGNGIKDVGEECDCGTEESCKRKGDHCCDPRNCKLKSHVQCSHFNNPGCCNKQCVYHKQGTLCRKAQGNCDVEEYCTGESPECPKDHFKRDGTLCGDSRKLFYGKNLRYKLTTTKLSHPITGQYFKFFPKQLTKDGHACMKIEMLGCEVGQAANPPTSLATNELYYHKPMCVTPNISDCTSVPDGTKLIYKSMPNKYCNHEHMLFSYQTDGTMIHKCSGKKVCPDANGMLILSDACEAEKSKFVRTKKLSLKLNGKCWDAKDGRPKSGLAVYLTSKCDDAKFDTNRLNMLQKDCTMPYVRNLDKKFFAASSFQLSYEPSRARLFDDKKWCPHKSENSWIQINIGKVAMIKTIQTKGDSKTVNRFHLHYSDDGVNWQAYKEDGGEDRKDEESICFKGKCSKTYDEQCQELWNYDARKADDECWNELNAKKNIFGTCDPTSNTICDTQNVFCGQLQCRAHASKPHFINYGTSYSKITLQNKICSAAAIATSEQAGLGMVEDGVKCGDDKICVNQQCKTLPGHGIKTCILVNGKECNNKGFCRDDGVCHCEQNLNPADGCVTKLPVVNGGWSPWQPWSVCTKGCGGGKTSRTRHCNQPVPKFNGEDCHGRNIETHDCNVKACPVGRSCKEIQLILQKEGRPLYDGIYSISPLDDLTLNVYCDMTTDGGGWTLIVSSHTNTWNETNVKLRSKDNPSLTQDYSVLKYADSIKRSYLIEDKYFEYRLEANIRGHGGGIWKAPKGYTIDSANKYQENVILQKKFGTWNYTKHGIQKRLPYLYKQRLTTANDPKKVYGSITDNIVRVFPSYWIKDYGIMDRPQRIWYWLREGDYTYPKSCLEVLFRSLREEKYYQSGVYKIQVHKRILETYCDLDRYGGGWTLVTKSSSSTGWTKETILERNADDVNNQDFSIFNFVDKIKHSDPAESSFEYMIEAEGENQNGGIFSVSNDFTLLSSPPKEKLPVLLKKFGNWDVDKENLSKFPIHIASKNGIFLTASSDNTSDTKGTIISSGSGSYMSILKKPNLLKVWVREGGSRKSCNDIKIHGLHKGKTDYKNGFYLIHGLQPVYCDMETTKNEGWTLLVSSVSNGWKPEEVLQRNIKHPSLTKDFSMLKLADSIKNISKSTTFKYMLDAKERRHWGGIWEAPIEYSFIHNSNKQTNVNLITKFNDWNPDPWKHGWVKILKRMPYVVQSGKSEALLTTAYYAVYFEFGSIIANNSDGRIPAIWTVEMKSPRAIWYWLNENDCDKDYAQVDGGYGEWSRWSRCSSFCDKGKQSRHRLCNSPIARCGGKECDENIPSLEERECTGECSVSKIMTLDSNYCIQPETDDCAPANNTKIVTRYASKCDSLSSQFVFNVGTGELTHNCSNKPVCFKDGSTSRNAELVVSSSCQKPTSSLYLKRTMFNSIQYGTLCMDPIGPRGDGKHIILWSGCNVEKRKFVFSNLPAGKVKTFYYANMDNVTKIEEVFNRTDYPSSPKHQGWLDNLDSQRNIGTQYVLRMQTIFIAPQTGEYVFVAACNDYAKVYLSQATNSTDKQEIIDVDSYIRYRQWNKSDKQKSKRIHLTVSKEYYLEAILLQKGGVDYISVGVILPDGTKVFPITSDYLKNI